MMILFHENEWDPFVSPMIDITSSSGRRGAIRVNGEGRHRTKEHVYKKNPCLEVFCSWGYRPSAYHWLYSGDLRGDNTEDLIKRKRICHFILVFMLHCEKHLHRMIRFYWVAFTALFYYSGYHCNSIHSYY